MCIKTLQDTVTLVLLTSNKGKKKNILYNFS